MKKEIYYVGLGKMGQGMVARLLEHGWTVHATDPAKEARDVAEGAGARVYESLSELLEGGDKKLIWLMVPHSVVQSVLGEMSEYLKEGDVVIDGGNSNFKETVQRGEELTSKGIVYMDAGTSGGPGGARDGACVMVGGDKDTYTEIEELFKDIAAPDSYGHVGPVGSGHFVKMVHNGIEYGMMQAIAEGFAVMKKSDFDLDLMEVSRIYNHNSVVESRLTGWLESGFKNNGVKLENISGTVSHSGEGLWTVETAKELDIPVPIIEGSLHFREESRKNPSYTGQILSVLRNEFGGHAVKKEGDIELDK